MIKIATWCVIGTAGILSAGCYQNVKGCLDPKAKNLDVRADVSCCCVYPSLKWSLVGSCAGGSIAWNDTCSVDDEQWMVVSYEMVLSEVVVQLNGLSIRTDSSVRLRLTDGALIALFPTVIPCAAEYLGILKKDTAFFIYRRLSLWVRIDNTTGLDRSVFDGGKAICG